MFGSVTETHTTALQEFRGRRCRWTKEAAEPELALRREVNDGSKTQMDLQETLAASLGKSILDASGVS